jgi:hypothetical protein
LRPSLDEEAKDPEVMGYDLGTRTVYLFVLNPLSLSRSAAFRRRKSAQKQIANWSRGNSSGEGKSTSYLFL